MTQSDDVIDSGEAADLSKQSERAVRAAIESGALPGVVGGGGRGKKYVTTRGDVVAWVRRGAPEVVGANQKTE